MMSIAQSVAESEGVCGGTWTDMFPPKQNTRNTSTMFVKRLLAVSLSNVLYLRGAFPENAFGSRSLDRLQLKIIKTDGKYEAARRVINWMKGCFDAIDKQYLREVVLGIFRDRNNSDRLIESYIFRFSYEDGKTSIGLYSDSSKLAEETVTENTVKATSKMIRTLILLTQHLDPLPEGMFLTMKIFYYDDVTPADYEPPGFKPAVTDSIDYEGSVTSVKVGDVSTPYHTIKVRAKADFTAEDDGEEEVVAQEDHGNTLAADESQFRASLMGSAAGTMDGSAHTTQVEYTNIDGIVMEATNSEVIEDSTTTKFRCPCGFNEDDGIMVMCNNCSNWGHAHCYKILQEVEVPNVFVCFYCYGGSHCSNSAVDPTLYGLEKEAARELCLMRRLLAKVSDLSLQRLNSPTLARLLGTDTNTANIIINRLVDEGYLQQGKKGKRVGKLINREVIEGKGMIEYFGLKDNKENVCENKRGNKAKPIQGQAGENNVNELAKVASHITLDEQDKAKKHGDGSGKYDAEDGRRMGGGGDAVVGNSRKRSRGTGGKEAKSYSEKEVDGKDVQQHTRMSQDSLDEFTHNRVAAIKRHKASIISPAFCQFME